MTFASPAGDGGRPIADYALLSDCRSAALVDGAGSVDWYCVPRFDSPSCLARLLDDDAGHWRLRPAGPYDVRRRYLPGTMVLETQFDTPSGMVTVTDALLFAPGARGHNIGMEVPHVLARVVEVTSGHVTMEGSFVVRPEYGMLRPTLVAVDGALVVRGGADVLVLSGPAPLVIGDTATWLLEVDEGERATFGLQHEVPWRPLPQRWTAEKIEAGLADTVAAWRSWSDGHDGYDGPWADLVHHSGRVLRSLTFAPSGAIVAAPTTSLAEEVGGGRNWDYRYAWLRSASLTTQALAVAACAEEATRLVGWLVATAGSDPHDEGDVQGVYSVGGEYDLAARELPHLRGWRGSRPVRVGNAAWSHRELDVCGELLNGVHLLQEQFGELAEPNRAFLRTLADTAARRWPEPGHGLWGVRDEPRQHLYSKLMYWVALDRAVGMAGWLGATDSAVAIWSTARDDVRRQILDEGWNERVGAYTQVLGGDHLDASALLLAISGFLPVGDPRMSSTIERIAVDLAAPCGLLWRYASEGAGTHVPGSEAAFVLCTYWLVQCHALAGDVALATELFERVTAYANDVGLLAEQADPTTGELLGNFPQALSHVGLVNAASAIADAGGR